MEALQTTNSVVLLDAHKTKLGLTLLTESTLVDKYKKSSTALGVLHGPCADFIEQTSNGHFYSQKVWEKVISSEYVVEAIKTKTLYGEIDHPEERLELKAEYAAVCCTGLWIDEQQQCLMGTFDILPTEKGKTLKALCDYGSILGVSSRGVGDLTYDPVKGNVVDEDTYIFVCFDVVVQPAAKKARQQFKSLTEAKESAKPVIAVIQDSISKSQSESDLGMVQSLIERLDLPTAEFKSLMEAKRTLLKKDESNSIINMNKSLRKDLEQAYGRIRVLEEQTDSNTILAELGFIRSQLTRVNENSSSVNSSMVKELKRFNKFQDSKLKEEFSHVTSDLEAANREVESLKEEVGSLKSENSTLSQKSKALQEAVDYAVPFVQKCKEQIKGLTESSQRLIEKNTRLGQKLEESVRVNEKNVEELSKAQTQVKGYKRIVENLQLEYLQQKERSFGMDLTQTKKKVLESKNLKEIDLIVSGVLSEVASKKKRVSVFDALNESDTDRIKPSSESGDTSPVLREAFRIRNGGNNPK